jgi:hypothetical protein
MSGGMIYMLAVTASAGASASAAGGTPGATSGMAGMSADGGLVPLPTLDYALVIFMVGYVVLVTDRLPRLSVVGTGDLQVAGHPVGASAAKPLAPTMAALTNIAMALTMGYMLTMMFV